MQNKDSKLYCKVFLKGKLQCEVDLIKGARGKWAYTFYDQRKKKKERRYWPSQSSGPVIEDPCNCMRCIPKNITTTSSTTGTSNHEDVDFSSPSTEEMTLVEYDNSQYNCTKNNLLHNSQQMNEYEIPNQYQAHSHSGEPQFTIVNLPVQVSYHDLNQYHQGNIYNLKSSNDFQEKRNQYILKASSDFQDNRIPQYILKSSNDFGNNNQRPWSDFLQNNNLEYNQDAFFVENSFL